MLTVWLAVRADAQPLAGLAIAGGFLAPFLVSTDSGSPALLFGYFVVLNAAIFALAWMRAWRALNALGFVFTFALGLFWGDRYYRPEHFATVEPFLVVFFLFYVTIAILYAKRESFAAKAPVDALLVFGVPLVGFALQAALVDDTRYGVAWSAVALAAFYGALAAALFRRAEPGLALLARAFLALAIIFATIAVPFAADPRWTSAWWALEAAGVYWIGCRQRQPLARAFALLLQAGAAAAFVVADVEPGPRLFLNATFFGTTLIALAALATAFVADRQRDAVSAHERALVPVLLLWGAAWWYCGGALEIERALPDARRGQRVPRVRDGQRRAGAAAAPVALLVAARVVRRGAAAGDGRRRGGRLGPDAHDALGLRLARLAARVGDALARAARGRCAARRRRARGHGERPRRPLPCVRARGVGHRARRVAVVGGERMGRPRVPGGDGVDAERGRAGRRSRTCC